MKKAIHSFNLAYYILLPVSILATRCHYRNVVVRGRRNLPRGEHYIIAPCHQNALMEPMAVLYFMHRSTVFLARADIFANPTVHRILTFLKILPVYRIRDGKSSLAKNEAIFDASKQVLLNRVPLCLMAEGRHNDRHQLLPLVKGMFRIAGETQSELGKEPLYIVPAGIDFDHYEAPYSNLVVDIGEPIPVQPFMQQFETDEPVALNQMRERLSTALKQQMHHIESKVYYDEVYALCHILNPSWRKSKHRRNTAWQRFVTRREIAWYFNATVNDGDNELPESIRQARAFLDICRRRRLNIRTAADHWNLAETVGMTAAVAALAVAAAICQPLRNVFLWSLMCNPLPIVPTHLIPKRWVKDPQFRSSFNYGIRLIVSLIYILACAVIVGCSRGLAWGVLALLTALVVARLNALLHPLLRQWLQNLRRHWLCLIHPADMRRLRQIQRDICLTVSCRP
ncbi:MAG: phospholipid/glycerol acyltransferase [bacterium P3]|nr:MAG: phospholipid/glycerol acyltransferase [bacterium P3]KWW42409.1 MAG: phospholipid/glycerol acyltransferase [bacterium F083]